MKYVIDLPDSEQVIFMRKEGMNIIVPKDREMVVFDEDNPLGGVVKLAPYKEPSGTVDDVWKMVCHILKRPDTGGMSWDDIEDCFGTDNLSHIVELSYAEAREKYDAWKKGKDGIHVGDEVNVDDYKGVVTWVNETHAEGFCIFKTHLIRFYRMIGNLVKTGRHFEKAVEFLKEMTESE